MTRYSFLLFLFLSSALAHHALSQRLYDSYQNRMGTSNLETGEWIVHLHSNSFLKNNEYFGKHTEGMTFFGTVFQPSIAFALNRKVELVGGWYFRQFFGQDGFDASLPVLTAKFEFFPGIILTIGQLNGHLAHGYLEPIFSTDNYFAKRPEYGLQFIIEKPRLKSDLWMNWERFITPGEDVPEVISGGWLMTYSLIDRTKKHILLADVQSVIHHHGGQVSNYSTPMISRANVGGGLKYVYKPRFKTINQVSLSNSLIQCLELSPNNVLPYQKGFGFYSDLTVSNSWASVGMSYFRGKYYFAPLGDYLFQSLSGHIPWYFDHSRNLLLHKLLLTHQAFGFLCLDLRFESYFDLTNNQFDYSYGINVAINQVALKKRLATF